MEVNMPDETETSLGKGKETRKRKTIDKKTNYASLQDMQKIISKSMEKDERKVKENNTKRSHPTPPCTGGSPPLIITSSMCLDPTISRLS